MPVKGGPRPMEAVRAVIMAAGKGTRLKSEFPKVLRALFGKPLVLRVLDTLASLHASEACVIVGHGRDQVKTALEAYETSLTLGTVVQEPQLGTGHAMLQVRQQLPAWN